MKKADIEKALRSHLEETQEKLFRALGYGNKVYAQCLVGEIWGVAGSMRRLGFIDHSEEKDICDFADAVFYGELPFHEVV